MNHMTKLANPSYGVTSRAGECYNSVSVLTVAVTLTIKTAICYSPLTTTAHHTTTTVQDSRLTSVTRQPTPACPHV